jgi:hypothetical protein
MKLVRKQKQPMSTFLAVCFKEGNLEFGRLHKDKMCGRSLEAKEHSFPLFLPRIELSDIRGKENDDRQNGSRNHILFLLGSSPEEVAILQKGDGTS